MNMFSSLTNKDIINFDEFCDPKLNLEDRQDSNLWNYNKERMRFMSYSQCGDSKSQSEFHHEDGNVYANQNIEGFQANTPVNIKSNIMHHQDKTFLNNPMMNIEQPMQI